MAHGVDDRDGFDRALSALFDDYQMGGVVEFAYRTLVLRRSPVQSRPPAPYRLVWAGESYEVWQRPGGPPP